MRGLLVEEPAVPVVVAAEPEAEELVPVAEGAADAVEEIGAVRIVGLEPEVVQVRTSPQVPVLLEPGAVVVADDCDAAELGRAVVDPAGGRCARLAWHGIPVVLLARRRACVGPGVQPLRVRRLELVDGGRIQSVAEHGVAPDGRIGQGGRCGLGDRGTDAGAQQLQAEVCPHSGRPRRQCEFRKAWGFRSGNGRAFIVGT